MTQVAPRRGVTDETWHQPLSALLQEAVARGDVPGVVATVVGRDGVLYVGAFGMRDARGNRAMTADTIFRIASMTKPLTTAAVLMLADQGRLHVDDAVGRYVPRFQAPRVLVEVDEARGTIATRPAAAVMTLRHLLTHTSGVGYSWSDPRLAAARRIAGTSNDSELPLLHEPGAQWTYGAGTRVLGEVVEAVSGQTIDAFLAARVTGPLGMVDTGFDVPAAQRDRLATVHQRTEDRLVEVANTADPAVAPRGDGGLYSTAADYGRFVQLILNRGRAGGRRLLSAAAIAGMTAPQTGAVRVRRQPAADALRSRPYPTGAGEDRWAFGLQVTSEASARPGLRRAGSVGWGGLYNTHFLIDPSAGVGAVVLMQVLPFYDEGAIRVCRAFEDAISLPSR